MDIQKLEVRNFGPISEAVVELKPLLERPRIKVASLHARIVLSKMRVPDIIPSQEKKLLMQVRSRKGDFIKKCQKLCEAV